MKVGVQMELIAQRTKGVSRGNHAFTLVEVMVALALFFIAVFAILGVVNQALSGARLLQKKKVDGGIVAAEWFALTNVVEEGLLSGDFGDDYPGHSWENNITPYGTNGLYLGEIMVRGSKGDVESTLYVLRYYPDSQQGNRPRSPFGAGRTFR
jgi:general secretion pathway protein I